MVTTTRRQTDLVFRAIADPTRRRIIGLLAGRRLSVNQIARNFHASRPAISKHLRVLRGAKLVSTRKKGTASICELNGKPLRAVNDWLREYEAFWDESLRKLKKFIEDDP